MMLSTHVLTGGLIGAVAASITPLNPALAITAGMLGGALPEFDFLMGRHRKTFHYPVLYGLGAALLLGITVLGFSAGLPLAILLLGAGTHSFMDMFAGAELRSWDRSEWGEEAVYNHLRGRWLRPRRWVYGGSIQDLLLSLICGAGLMALTQHTGIRLVSGVVLLFSVLYTATIRRIGNQVVAPEYHTLNAFTRSTLQAAWNRFRM